MSPILDSFGGLSARAFGLIGAKKPIVSGGTLSSDSTYYYRTFTSSGSLVVADLPLTVDYLVVAGGGGGAEGGMEQVGWGVGVHGCF